MSKIFVLLSCAVIIGFVVGNVNLNGKKQESSSCGKHPCLPGFIQANSAIDLVKGAFTSPVILFSVGDKVINDGWRGKIWSMPNEYNAYFENDSLENIQLFKNKKQYMEYLSKISQVKFGFGRWFSKTREVAEVEEITGRKTHQYMTVQQEYRKYRIVLVPNPTAIKTTEEFQKDLDQLPDEYESITYINFIQKFGTHYITELLVGGRAESKTIISQKYVNQRGERKTKAEGSHEFTWLKLFDKDQRHTRQDHLEFVRESRVDTLMKGGRAGLQLKDLRVWLESLKTSVPAVLNYKVELLSEVINNDEIKRENVKKAISEYLDLFGKK